MLFKSVRRRITLTALWLMSLLAMQISLAQFEGPVLGDGPWVFQSFEEDYLKVSVLARGLDHPFGMVFIPGTATLQYPYGDILFTERNTGRVRYFSKGQLQAEPLLDMKDVFPMEQLFDIELHPGFGSNGLIYFTYIKTAPRPDGSEGYWVTTALARAKFADGKLSNVEEVYEANAFSGNIGGASSRLHFLADGTLLFGVSHRIDREAPQSLQSDIGKVLRLNDDGSIPADNPFVGVEGADPQIFTWGNRSVMDFATHPETGLVWELENGPQGGDEVNILQPGQNYGWPIATFGRDYDGSLFNPAPWVEGTQLPVIFWVPSVTVAGMTFYTGEQFSSWKNNLLVTTMMQGRITNTGHLERVVLNERGEEMRREQLLNGLKQRIRYVEQGADGFLYLLTDHSDGALLKLEPTDRQEALELSDAVVFDNTDSGEQQDWIAGSDCRACHRQNSRLLGPSYQEIADRYERSATTLAMLAEKIIAGGEGNWGETPMSAHPNLSKQDAQTMVERIFQLKTD